MRHTMPVFESKPLLFRPLKDDTTATNKSSISKVGNDKYRAESNKILVTDVTQWHTNLTNTTDLR